MVCTSRVRFQLVSLAGHYFLSNQMICQQTHSQSFCGLEASQTVNMLMANFLKSYLQLLIIPIFHQRKTLDQQSGCFTAKFLMGLRDIVTQPFYDNHTYDESIGVCCLLRGCCLSHHLALIILNLMGVVDFCGSDFYKIMHENNPKFIFAF